MKFNQKLLEFAGFKVKQVKVQGLPDTLVHTPEGMEYVGDEPDFTISLDACFQHLVPKTLIKIKEQWYADKGNYLTFTGAYQELFNYWILEILNGLNPALALCKAIEKIIDAPDNT